MLVPLQLFRWRLGVVSSRHPFVYDEQGMQHLMAHEDLRSVVQEAFTPHNGLCLGSSG